MEEEVITTVTKVLNEEKYALDHELFTHALYSHGVITHSQSKCIQREVEQYFGCDTDKQSMWLRHIVRLISREKMLETLRSIGMNHIASRICELMASSAIKTDSISEIQKACALQKDYSALCKKRENKIMQINMAVDFENMTSYLLGKLQLQSNRQTRQRALDKLAVVVGVRHFILDTVIEIRAVLNELKHIKDNNLDLDQRFSTAIYQIVNIYLNRQTYDFDTAETSLVEVKQLCFNNGPNWLRVLVFIAEQALYRRKYALTSDKTYLNRSLVACDHACSLVSLETDIHKFRMSNFLQLCKVLSLLSIGEGFYIDTTKDICTENLIASRAILTIMGRKLNELPNREKAIYRVCMARQHEKDNPRLALANARMAKDMETCAHMTTLEKDNLARLVERLQSEIDNNNDY